MAKRHQRSSAHRPRGHRGAIDEHLDELTDRLRRLLAKTQRMSVNDTLSLKGKSLAELAAALVEFAEDVHANVGIWDAYEGYNRHFFGCPLPMTEQKEGKDGPIDAIRPDRIRHLLWILYPHFIPGLIISPTHQGLGAIAEAVADFLGTVFRSIPRDSGVTAFLRMPNDHAWDVKRKLVWLGTHSYMFRSFHAAYMAENSETKADVGHTDDFLCQECVRWSGLGVIDILAGALDISDDDRTTQGSSAGSRPNTKHRYAAGQQPFTRKR